MTRNFSTTLKTITGADMKRTEAPDSPFATIGDVIGDALLALGDGDRNLSGEDKNKRYKLWKKLAEGGEKSISVEEASIIKQVVGAAFGPLIVGQVFEFLEGD